MIEPQRRYFQEMRAFSPNRVHFLEAKTIEANVKYIQNNVSGLTEHRKNESVELFEKMTSWLRKTAA
jgi:hypothetical protein